MAIEPDRNPLSHLAQSGSLMRFGEPNRTQVQVKDQPSFLKVERRAGDIVVNVGLKGDLTITYPERNPLRGVVAGRSLQSFEMARLTAELFTAVVIMEDDRIDQGTRQTWQDLRTGIVRELADRDRLDVVDAGRLMPSLPGVDRTSMK